MQNEQEHSTTQIQDNDVTIPHQPSRGSDRSQAVRENTGKYHNHSMGAGLLEELGIHSLITCKIETGTLSITEI